MNKKAILALIIILVLIATACLIYFYFKNKNPNELTLFGNIEIRQSDLAFRVKGRLLKLYKEEGDEVQEGELLAELDSDTYKTELNKLKAQVREKRADKLQKTAVYNFNSPLCLDSTISKEECSNLKYQMEAAKGAYDNTMHQLEEAIINLDDTKLYAPFDGTILSRIREKGTIVGVDDPIYSISKKEPVWVRTYIEEEDLGKIKLGQKALVYTDSRPKEPYSAHIGFISPVAEFTPKTVETTSLRVDLVYRLRVIIDNVDPYLRQGMPVTIKVSLDEQ